MFKRVLLLCCIGLLSACAARPQMSTAGAMVPPAGQAYGILAVTFNSLDHDTTVTSVVVEGPWGRKEFFANNNNYIRDAGDVPDTTGQLQLLTLPPGHYTMTDTWTRWGNPGMDMSRRIGRLPLNQGFDVKAGEVVYLGEVHVDVNFQPTATLKDAHQRDFNHIKVMWGVPDTSNIQIRLPRPLDAAASQTVQPAQ
ncbi:hypothetical protein [Silvimonas iriomotensis]|uniref:DUF4382 domain-containing protein n=1 Tax=Silvimonas iriomotensis TaxID=449662 RepID=A0ABQ2P4S2_9NEIS|nr:hypothetical protein [Silvimonas iriomotensis]GGP18180.1 hypothetical protein GCM10010970_03580 [Silvimonas iriomotensis]